jgi:hypothetical protein
MANIRFLKTFDTGVNRDVSLLAADIDAWLKSFGGTRLNIIDATVNRRTLQSRGNDLRVAILYDLAATTTTSGLPLQAKVFTTVGANLSAENALSAFFLYPDNSGFVAYPLFILDCSERTPNAGGSAYIALFTDFTNRRMFGRAVQTYFAAPLADIAGGAVGNCAITDAFGLSCSVSFSIRNVSASIWKAGERNYTVRCPLTGLWIGSAPCQAAAPATTPLPAYRAGAFPRVGDVLPADVASMEYAYRALPYTPVR